MDPGHETGTVVYGRALWHFEPEGTGVWGGGESSYAQGCQRVLSQSKHDSGFEDVRRPKHLKSLILVDIEKSFLLESEVILCLSPMVRIWTDGRRGSDTHVSLTLFIRRWRLERDGRVDSSPPTQVHSDRSTPGVPEKEDSTSSFS